ncbi:TonB-dependent receptor [Luteimonas sp. RIT-PG2_3]
MSNRSPRITTLSLACAAGVLALACSATALAQDATAPTSREGVQTLETVTATAQKRVQVVTEIPMSISVIGEEQLDRLQVNNVNNLAGLVPGLQVSSLGWPGRTLVAIRGIMPMGNTASTAIYVDDIPLTPNGSLSGGTSGIFDMLPYDLQSVEVLRGPQGTLYGASALGGLVKYVAKRPDLENFEGRAGGTVSVIDDGGEVGYAGRAAINAPLIDGKLALRVSYAEQTTPGWVDNTVLRRRDTNDVSQNAGRLALLWKPSETVEVMLSALTQKNKGDNIATIALDRVTLEPKLPGHANEFLFMQPSTIDTDIYGLSVDWDLGWADFSSSTSWMDSNTWRLQDLSAEYVPLLGGVPGVGPVVAYAALDTDISLTKLTQEFRLTSKGGGRLEWQVGAFYTDEDADYIEFGDALNPTWNPVASIFTASVLTNYREKALFGNTTWKFNDKFDLALGLRYAQNDQVFDQRLGGLLGGGQAYVGNSSESVTTWSVSPRYFFGKDSMLYLRAATGYRAGSPNPLIANASEVPRQVDSDTLTNYELGLKTHLWERRALVEVAAFRINWEDIRLNLATAQGISYGLNGGGARSQGVEFTGSLMPVDGLRLSASLAYTDAELTSPIPGQAPAGTPLPQVPEWTGSLQAFYEFPTSGEWVWGVGGALRYYGERPLSVAAAQSVDLDSYSLLDLTAQVSSQNTTWRFFVTNATNEDTFTAASRTMYGSAVLTRWNGVMLQPRTVGVSFDYRF